MSILRLSCLVLVVSLLLIGIVLGIYAIARHSAPIVTHPQANPVQTLGSNPGPDLVGAAAESSAVNAQTVVTATRSQVHGNLRMAQAATQSSAVNTQAAETATPTQLSGGVRMTQTFKLQAGWNTIYLELEPDNPSPPINAGTDEDPFMVHEKSTIEALFDGVTDLECILAWNVPLSSNDYVVDQTEAGLVQPGWRRYVTGAGGVSDGCSPGIPADQQDIPTDLVSLHANQGYLVKLADDAEDATLSISGQPQAGHRRWIKGSYNLAGFPIPEGGTPTVGVYFADSPITEVYALERSGTWRELASFNTGDQVWAPSNAELQHGQAYLVYYDDQKLGEPDDYRAPLHIADLVGEGLQFGAGVAAVGQTVRIENRSDIDATIEMRLTQGEGVMALYFVDTRGTARIGVTSEVTTEIEAGGAQNLTFRIQSSEQSTDGAAILEIRSDELDTRWLIPVTARNGSLAGLWVGDVTVNDVSESRLGGTNVKDGQLTVALRSRNDSGIVGAATLTEEIVGDNASVAISLGLTLPTGEAPAPLQPLVGQGAYIAGYVFEDANQNGQRDGDELGLAAVSVTLAGTTTSTTTTTAVDGAYLFENLASDTYDVNVANPANYTSEFDVILPDVGTGTSRPNLLPNTVTVTRTEAYTGIVAVEPTAYLSQVMPPDFVSLPYEDGTHGRMEPPINFGLATSYPASLWTTDPGGCSELGDKVSPLGAVKNGWLNASLPNTRLNPRPGADERLLLGAGERYAIVVADGAGNEVACGEVVVGSPTRLADGRGSEFTFRILLRVDEEGNAELLPYYQTQSGATGKVTRISSANFSFAAPTITSGQFTDTLSFSIVVDPDDPRNPFKHKYHPDHDNLDRQFQPIDFDAVDPNLWEAYEIRRDIRLQPIDDLRDIPAFADLDPDAAQELAVEVDWGGATWGGLYQEVVGGVHKNDITVQGHFVVRHVLAADELEVQPYDR